MTDKVKAAEQKTGGKQPSPAVKRTRARSHDGAAAPVPARKPQKKRKPASSRNSLQAKLRNRALAPPGKFAVPGDAAREMKLVTQIQEALKPEDLIEAIYAEDFAYETAQVHKLRGIPGLLAESAIAQAAVTILEPALSERERSHRPRLWGAKCFVYDKMNQGLSELAASLEQHGSSLDHALAEAYRMRFDDIQKFNGLIAGGRARRDALLRDFERRRELKEARRRDAAEGTVDAGQTDSAEDRQEEGQ